MLNNRTEFERVVYDEKFRPLITQKQVRERTAELGKQITEDYRGLHPILICVLNGGFIFMADLVRQIELDLEVDFIRISSYGDAMKSSGNVRLVKDVNAELKDRHVLLVEDIVDTGLSLQFLSEKMAEYHPASIKFVTLLWKKEKARVETHIDYVGFEIPDSFVVGYGLDHKQILRNLPAVYVMD